MHTQQLPCHMHACMHTQGGRACLLAVPRSSTNTLAASWPASKSFVLES